MIVRCLKRVSLYHRCASSKACSSMDWIGLDWIGWQLLYTNRAPSRDEDLPCKASFQRPLSALERMKGGVAGGRWERGE